MTLARYQNRRDIAEPAIVEALERVGAWPVHRLNKPLDLLVGFRQRLFLLEVKSNHRKPDKRQVDQTEFLARSQRAGLPVYTVRTVDDALQAIGAVR